MTEREKILRDGLEGLDKGFYGHRLTIREAQRLIRETIAKADTVPRDPRLPDYLKDDPWALQMLDYVDGLKDDAAPKDGWIQVGWAWKQGETFFFTDISNRPRTGFPIYLESPK